MLVDRWLTGQVTDPWRIKAQDKNWKGKKFFAWRGTVTSLGDDGFGVEIGWNLASINPLTMHGKRMPYSILRPRELEFLRRNGVGSQFTIWERVNTSRSGKSGHFTIRFDRRRELGDG